MPVLFGVYLFDGCRVPWQEEMIVLLSMLLVVRVCLHCCCIVCCFARYVGGGVTGDRDVRRVVFCALALLAKKIVVPGTCS